MKKKEATSILKKQIQKLDNKENHNNSWVLETTHYIDVFFGINSKQSEKMARFNFITYAGLLDNDGNKNINNIKVFLESCIETINNLGLYKEPKKNFFSKINEGILILILTAIGSTSFLLGKCTTDVANFELRNENKSLNKKIDSLKNSKKLIIPPPVNKNIYKATKDTSVPKK